MSTLAQLLAKPGAGYCFYLDVSTDRFSTVSYRWADQYGAHDGTNQYDPRIKSVSPISRGLGTNNYLTSSGFTVELANEDGGIDFLVSSMTTVTIKSQWRLTLVVYDRADPTDRQTKVLGKFQVSRWPTRTTDSITVGLSDRALGEAAEFAMTPTIADVQSALSLTNWGVYSVADQPIPLVFSPEGPFSRVPLIQLNRSVPIYGGTDWSDIYYAVCATTDTAAYGAGEIAGIGFGPSFPHPDVAGWSWSADKTSTITKDGKNWKVYWIVMSPPNDFWAEHLARQFGVESWTDINDLLAKVPTPWCYGWPFSARTSTAPTFGRFRKQTPAQTVYDLLAYYAKGLTTSDVDSSSFDTVTASYPMSATRGWVDGGAIAGKRGSGFELRGGGLRQTISEICEGGHFDVFSGWDGKFYAMSHVRVFDDFVTSATTVQEFQMGNVVERIPTTGERWAPWNRLYIETDDFGGVTYGPFDHTAITTWGRVLPRTINARWVSPMGANIAGQPAPSAGWSGTNLLGGYLSVYSLVPKVRPVVEFDYPLEALGWELGTYVHLTWTRGGSLSAYSTSLFRIEGLDFDAERAKVRVTAVWQADWQTYYPWLLDSRTPLLVVAAAGGRTASVTNSSTEVTFSSGDLESDGVEAGDILWLLDATQADNAFTRFRGLLIENVTSATTLEVDSGSDLTFDAASPTAVSAWEITRGHLSYPTAGDDPTNYPQGSAMYGCATADRDVGGSTYGDDRLNIFSGG